jgi:hypothetical protein
MIPSRIGETNAKNRMTTDNETLSWIAFYFVPRHIDDPDNANNNRDNAGNDGLIAK